MSVQTFLLDPSEGPDGLERLAGVLEQDSEPTAVLDATLLTPRAALAPMLDDPDASTALLVRPSRTGGDLRVRHHRVMSVGSHWHRVAEPDHRWVGAAVIAAQDSRACAAAIRAMAGHWRAGDLGDGGTEADAVQLVAVAIVRSGVPCRAVACVDVPWFRGRRDTDAEEAAVRQVREVSAERIARLQANRVDDGLYSTFVVRRASKPLTRLALRLGWSPNAITLLSFAIGLTAAALFAIGLRWSLVLGAIALQVSLVIDCVDGEVARSTRRFTALGAWLDAWTDRVKEFCAYAGLAWGSAVVLGVDAWPMAVLLVVLQTTRHVSDYDFSRVQWQRESIVPATSLSDPGDPGHLAAEPAAGQRSSGSGLSQAMAASTRLNRRDPVRWAKRAIHLPIGERWLIISVVAAVASGAWALGVLLAAGVLAFGYVAVGRSLRTLTWRGVTPPDAVTLLRRQGDAGPLVAAVAWVSTSVRPMAWRAVDAGRWSWAVPAALRFGELGLVALLVLARWPGLAPLAFAWVAVVAFHHYDVLYRALAGVATPRWLTWAGLGWDGRSIVVITAALAGVAVMTQVLGVGSIVLAVVLVAVASAQWLLSRRVRPARMSA